jgi:large subunit ribosomal protein L30
MKRKVSPKLQKQLKKKLRRRKMSEETAKNIAIVRIRGGIGLKKEIKAGLTILRLYKKNYCRVIKSSKSNLGMIQKVKDYITWGEIDEETLKLLKEKRGEKTSTKTKSDSSQSKEGKEIFKPYFRLHPPRGGFARKGIKIPFALGGALGNRKEKINDLIKRMI